MGTGRGKPPRAAWHEGPVTCQSRPWKTKPELGCSELFAEAAQGTRRTAHETVDVGQDLAIRSLSKRLLRTCRLDPVHSTRKPQRHLFFPVQWGWRLLRDSSQELSAGWEHRGEGSARSGLPREASRGRRGLRGQAEADQELPVGRPGVFCLHTCVLQSPSPQEGLAQALRTEGAQQMCLNGDKAQPSQKF